MTEKKITKDAFVQILREIGLSDEQMKQLHRRLETRFPEDHARFLAWLDISAADARQIRANCG